MDIEIRKLTTHDLDHFIELITIFESFFEMKNFKMPDKIHLQKLLENADFFVFVALLNKNIIGGMTCYIMHQYYSKSPLVYLFDLAVKTKYQRQGTGKMLIDANNNYCKTIDAEVVMVQADELDGYAIDFYQSTGAIGQKVIHFDYLIDEIKKQ